RPQFAAHRNAHDCKRPGVHFEFMKLHRGLRAQYHSRERAGDEHDGLRFHPHEINLVNEIAPGDAKSEKRTNRFLGKQSDSSQSFHPFTNPSAGEKIHDAGNLTKQCWLGQWAKWEVWPTCIKDFSKGL